MHADILDYDLPPALIAQQPVPTRDQSRLLVVRRSEGKLAHHVFADLPRLLNPGDLLILNDTRVLAARVFGRRVATGGKWEGLFLLERSDGVWEMLCQAGGRPRPGEVIAIDPGLELHLVEKLPEGHWLVRPHPAGPPAELLDRFGHIPLPPYIRKGRDHAEDRGRYQTVYAHTPGAVAAPTAGLHFTPRLFERLAERGVERAFVTLHVGLGTFQPIQSVDVRQHRMHRERAVLPEETVRAVTACRARGGRVVAVGTTSVRVLETAAATGPWQPWSGETDLFIFPPYEFRVVDALVTNFHLPRSTLLLLVAAFTGAELTRRAYRTAVEQAYRFYSYGDAMLIL